MRRNSTQIELITPGATTWLPWISDPGSNRVDGLGDEPGLSFGATWISDPGSNRVDGYPNFDGFTGQSRSIREAAWQAFLDSGEELEVIPDPEPPPPDPDWMGFKTDYKSSPTIRAWFAGLDPMDREDLAAMVAAQSINGLTAAMADVDYSAVKSELNDLLALHNIGLTLP